MTKNYVLSGLQAKLLEIGSWLEEKKALHPVLLDLDGKNPLTEGVIIAGASSARHARGLADFLLEKSREKNYDFLHLEGYRNGAWILLDFNDVLVNIMQTEHRELYRLEELFPESKLIR